MNNINGKFINVKTVLENENNIIKEKNINEVEEVIKEEKKEKRTNKGKKYNKKKIDYEKLVSEVKYIELDEQICPTCGEKLIVASKR